MSEQLKAGVASGAAEILPANQTASRASLVWLVSHFVLGCLVAVAARIVANRSSAGPTIDDLYPSMWDQVLTMGPWFAVGSVLFLGSHLAVHRYFRHLTKHQRDVIWIPCIVAAIAGLMLTFTVIWLGSHP